MPTPVAIEIEFFPGVAASRPVVLVGQTLRARVRYRDEDGDLVEVTGATVTLRRPDGNAVILPAGSQIADGEGGYIIDLLPDLPGSWALRVEIAGSAPAVTERRFAAQSSEVVPSDPDAILVTEDLAPVVTQVGDPLRAKRIPQLPQAQSPAGLSLVGARGGEAVQLPATALGDLLSGPPPIQALTVSGTQELAFGGLETAFDLTLAGDCAFSFADAVLGRAQRLHLLLRQDDAAGHRPSFPASVLWPGGVAPSLNTAAGRMDYFRFVSMGGATIICEVQVRLSDPAQAGQFSVLLRQGGGRVLRQGGGAVLRQAATL